MKKVSKLILLALVLVTVISTCLIKDIQTTEHGILINFTTGNGYFIEK